MQSDNENENIIIARQPIGVAVGIIAWNFPFFLIARKMGPALVTGNTIVIKPSSDTPGLRWHLQNWLMKSVCRQG